MGIQALPATAVRALGSGQVLTDPASLIKELLDNSLDASATTISVDISQNTLDVLQVKDNGHGIPPEDREFMAVRYCTSKIKDYEDIQDCRSLGFRGEALASAAELAGGLVITTMVEGEKVAMACTCDRVGRVTAKKPVGAMKGTTVRVTDFFKFLPVRRESAVKAAQKNLSKVRTLLQRYYLSHPTCRLSLRILVPPQKSKAAGGQSEDIVYAPSKSVSEAVMKAVGKEVVVACQWINTEPEEATDGGLGRQKIGVEAFMPKPDSDPAIICRKPQCTNFVFVDSRPVSCARGTLKQILSLYKSYLKSASSSGSAISDPFLYLNLRCPPGTYDPNIEPAKDDVMFSHADQIIETVEVVLKGLYGELKNKISASGSAGKLGKGAEIMAGGFELLLARKKGPKPGTAKPSRVPEIDEEEEEMAAQQMDMMMELDEGPAAGPVPTSLGKAPPVQVREESPHKSRNRDGSVRPPMFSIADAPSPGLVPPGESNQESVPSAPPPTRTVQTPKRRPTNWGFNMSSGHDEDEDDLALEAAEAQIRSELAEEQANEAAARDIAISNPWTAAKMNSPASRSNAPLSSAPGLIVTKRTFRPATVIDPPRNLRSSPQVGSSPSLHYSVTPASSTRRMITMFPTPSASLPSSPQGNAGIMQGWLQKGPQQSPQNAAPLVAHRRPINEDYDEDIDDQDEEPRGGYQKSSSKSVPRIVQDQQPKRRRLNVEHEFDYDEPPPGYDDDPDFVRTQPPKSPHKNRFLKAVAALSSQVDQGPDLEPVEPEPQQRKPPPPPPPVRQRQQPKKPKLTSLDVPPPKASQTTNITKPTSCPIAQLRASFSHLRTSDAYNRLISIEGNNSSSKRSVPPKATQGNIGIFFEIDNAPNDPYNSQVQQREKAIVLEVKRWMDRLAEERGVETEPFWLEFDHECGPEGEKSIWVCREGDSDGEDMEDEDEEY